MNKPTEIQELVQGDIERSAKMDNIYRHFRHKPFSSNGTEYPKNSKQGGVGITKKSAHESKTRRKMAETSRKINRKTADKKFRPTGSKRRKSS